MDIYTESRKSVPNHAREDDPVSAWSVAARPWRRSRPPQPGFGNGRRQVSLRQRLLFDGFAFGHEGICVYWPDPFWPDPFDLSSADEDAAEQLNTILLAPDAVHPFHPFGIGWEVTGPSKALQRVQFYRISEPAGQLFPPNPQFPFGVQSTRTSIWKDGTIKLYANFASGTRLLAERPIRADLSLCTKVPIPLSIAVRGLGNAGDEFVARVREEAGDDIEVRVTSDPCATMHMGQFTFSLGLELENDKGVVSVQAGMTFDVGAGGEPHLTAVNLNRTIEVGLDPSGWWNELLNPTIGKFEPPAEPQTVRTAIWYALGELADSFAAAMQQAAVPTDELPPKFPVAARLDVGADALIVTVCTSFEVILGDLAVGP